MSNKIFNELKELTDLLKKMNLGSKSQDSLNKIKSKIEDLKETEEFKNADFMTKAAFKTLMNGAISLVKKTEEAIKDLTDFNNQSDSYEKEKVVLNEKPTSAVSINKENVFSITGFNVFEVDGRRNILKYLDNLDNSKTNLSEKDYVLLASLFELSRLLKPENEEEKLFLNSVVSVCENFLNPKNVFNFDETEVKRFEKLVGPFDSKNIFISKHFENLVLNLDNKTTKDLLENSALLNFVKNICEKTNIKNNGDLESFYPSAKLIGKLIEQKINSLYKEKSDINSKNDEEVKVENHRKNVKVVKETKTVKKVAKKEINNAKKTTKVERVVKKTSDVKLDKKVPKTSKVSKVAKTKTKVKI